MADSEEPKPKRKIKTSAERYMEEREHQLDFILKKIHKHKGTSGLTPDELFFLDRVSQELKKEQSDRLPVVSDGDSPCQ